MKDIDQSRLASTLALIVGLWVLISPAWIPMSAGAQVSTLVVGIVMVTANIVQYVARNSVPSWVNGIAAAWLFISIFVFSMSAGAVWSAVLAAIASVILALWDGAEIEHFAHRRMPAM